MTKSQTPKPNGTRRIAASGHFRLGFWTWLLGFGICAMSASGCTKARAQTVPDGPPLAIPSPPPRIIAPAEEPQVAAVAPPVETPTATTPTPPPRTPPRPVPATSTPAAQPAPPAPAPAEPPRVTRQTAADIAEERKIRDVLQRASRDINRVDYRRLTTDGRAQYDQSKSLAEQAEQAVKDRNWVFAETLADKAATLAAELLAR
jgi:hypothetical protein